MEHHIIKTKDLIDNTFWDTIIETPWSKEEDIQEIDFCDTTLVDYFYQYLLAIARSNQNVLFIENEELKNEATVFEVFVFESWEEKSVEKNTIQLQVVMNKKWHYFNWHNPINIESPIFFMIESHLDKSYVVEQNDKEFILFLKLVFQQSVGNLITTLLKEKGHL